MGRKCAVPHCYTGYKKCTDKASLYKVPDDEFFLTKWQEAIAREDRPITPKDYVCEKHFKEEDILRKRIRKDVLEEYQRPRLKPDAIPSIFPELPEFILKMTKKRRKLNTPVPTNIIDISVSSDEEKLKPKEEPNYEMKESEMINIDEIDIKAEISEVSSTYVEEIEEYNYNGANIFHCDECSYKSKFSHNILSPKIKHLSGDNAYMTCEYCMNYKTKWESTYINHMKFKHRIVLKTIYKCPLCSFKTKNIHFLVQHCEKQHESEELTDKDFKCDLDGCNYQTYFKALLNLHSFTHEKVVLQKSNNVRMFSCKECDFISNYKGSLVSHVNISHNKKLLTNEELQLQSKKLFSCRECYFQTTSKGALTKHTNSAHNDGNIEGVVIKHDVPENIQDRKFLNKDGLNRVVKRQKVTIKCSRCPYKTHSETLLQKHLLKHQILLTNTAQ